MARTKQVKVISNTPVERHEEPGFGICGTNELVLACGHVHRTSNIWHQFKTVGCEQCTAAAQA